MYFDDSHYFEQRFLELVLPGYGEDAGWYKRSAECEEAFLQRMEGIVVGNGRFPTLCLINNHLADHLGCHLPAFGAFCRLL